MKLPLLLTQYLREYGSLRLPGIGKFYSTSPEVGSGERDETPPVEVIFENDSIKEPDELLIEFIRKHTGKIKPLALADLDSYLQSGFQLLNIDKPFHIEGMGILKKNKDGQLEFIVDEELSTLLKKEDHHITAKEKSKFTSEKKRHEVQSNSIKKFIWIGIATVSLIIVLIGGYLLYNRNKDVQTSEDNLKSPPSNVKKNPSDTVEQKTNTTIYSNNNANNDKTIPASAALKFIIETTTNKKRALKRYNQLKSYSLDIKIDTKDSLEFKLYFLVNSALPHDTLRIKDSLSRYYHSKVRIEQ